MAANSRDHEGKLRGACLLHPQHSLYPCQKFICTPTDNTCGGCLCVARMHVEITQNPITCTNCGPCDSYEPAAVNNLCLNCNCSHKHGNEMTNTPNIGTPNNWEHIGKIANAQRNTGGKQKKVHNVMPNLQYKGKGKKNIQAHNLGRPKNYQKHFDVTPLYRVGECFKWRIRNLARKKVTVQETDTFENVTQKCKTAFSLNAQQPVFLMTSSRGPVLESTGDWILQFGTRSKLLYLGWSSDEEEDGSEHELRETIEKPGKSEATEKPLKKEERPNDKVTSNETEKGEKNKEGFQMTNDLGQLAQMGMTMPRPPKTGPAGTPATINRLSLKDNTMQWEQQCDLVWVQIDTQAFDKGGMREAFRVKITKGSSDYIVGKDYVAKRTIDNDVDNMAELKKDLQTQETVRGLVREFNAHCRTKNVPSPSLRVIPASLMTLHDSSSDMSKNTYALEEYLEGTFVKVLNNTGHVLSSEGDAACKMLALAHFTIDKYDGQAMVTDLQGVNYSITDPQMAHRNEFAFARGNLNTMPVAIFKQGHKCNDICKALELTDLTPSVEIVREVKSSSLPNAISNKPADQKPSEVLPSMVRKRVKKKQDDKKPSQIPPSVVRKRVKKQDDKKPSQIPPSVVRKRVKKQDDPEKSSYAQVGASDSFLPKTQDSDDDEMGRPHKEF